MSKKKEFLTKYNDFWKFQKYRGQHKFHDQKAVFPCSQQQHYYAENGFIHRPAARIG